MSNVYVRRTHRRVEIVLNGLPFLEASFGVAWPTWFRLSDPAPTVP